MPVEPRNISLPSGIWCPPPAFIYLREGGLFQGQHKGVRTGHEDPDALGVFKEPGPCKSKESPR